MRKPCARSQRERLPLAVEGDAVDVPDAVDPDRKRAARGDRRVELPHRPGGSVARVRRRALPLGRLTLGERTKTLEWHVHLAAHLEHCGRPLLRTERQRERDRADRPQVRRHVLAPLAVTARRTAREDTVLVQERHREPVDLGLHEVRDRILRAETLPHVVGELGERLVARDLVERAHGREVLDLPEPVRRGRAHALGRRVRGDELGMLRLEPDELVVEPVELGVRHDRLVLDVVRRWTPRRALGAARLREPSPTPS